MYERNCGCFSERESFLDNPNYKYKASRREDPVQFDQIYFMIRQGAEFSIYFRKGGRKKLNHLNSEFLGGILLKS
ncbi:hypothetical protein RCL_jg26363.t1 [Rhizophagus clarus]|uniref:Uncharacterized protein n=1 Tax=Rhizophagus clarus TaxID=94130 RepID=A0A8H3QEP2_9GLOM|nr:hypothetical protein RCL_jg26363.t1 [Rhizophagus clarus]